MAPSISRLPQAFTIDANKDLHPYNHLNIMSKQQQRRIGALLFPAFELLDVFGPLEMFTLLQERGLAEIIMVAQQPGSVSSVCGPACIATVGFDNCPDLDVLLVPGGQGTRNQVGNPTVLSFLRRLYPTLEFLASICTGAGLLAAAGLLNGKRATSNKQSFAWVVSQGPHVTWVAEARWVEDGNIITAGGVAAGMDMALRLVERLTGAEMANLTAQYTEYDWHRDPNWDPFARQAGLV